MSKEIICMKGFPNIGNSCYMDTVLFCLFSTPNEFINRYIFQARKSFVSCLENTIIKDFQKLFLEISNYFQNCKETKMKSCQELKKVIKKYRKICPSLLTYPDFSNTEQHEATEFLQFLLTPFGLNGMKDVKNHLTMKKRYGISNQMKQTRWLEWKERTDKKSSIVYYVNHDNYRKPKKSIQRFLNNTEIVVNLTDTMYKKCIVNESEESHTFTSYSDLFIVYADRINPFTGQVSHSKIHIDKHIPNSQLQIDAVILHLGDSSNCGHYICFKKVENEKWVLYDDLKSSLQVFDSWNKVLMHKDGMIQKNGVLFFYSKQKSANSS